MLFLKESLTKTKKRKKKVTQNILPIGMNTSLCVITTKQVTVQVLQLKTYHIHQMPQWH